MKLTFSNTIFEVEDLLSGKINQKKFIESERFVLNFIRSWFDDQDYFPFATSGSTGKQKKVNLTKEQLSYSANQTIKYLFGEELPKRSLLCINPTFIGGAQVITRSLISDSDLIVLPPSSNPLVQLDQSADLISLVPLQVETILEQTPEKFELLKHVLIGGAELRPGLIKKLLEIKSTKFHQTYGMTETASHIAIKSIDEECYTLLGDIEIQVDHRDCLKLKGSVTNHEWLQTNDLIEMKEDKFIWIGRVDWVINSGGIKISPESLERKINHHWPNDTVVVTSIPDEKLGEKAVLVSSRPLLSKIKLSSLFPKFEIPKQEFILTDWPINDGGKIDRVKIKDWVKQE